MRDLNVILRTLLGAAAFTTFAACEEVDPKETRNPSASRPPPTATQVSEPTGPPTPTVKTDPPAPGKPVVAETLTADSDDPDGKKPKELIAAARDAISAGELNRAARLARLAAKKAPADSKLKAAALNTLGRAQLKGGQRRDAIASFEGAVEIDPSSSWANNNLGLALIYDQRYPEAVSALEEATQLEPVPGYMWNNLGMAYEHLDRLEEARVAYRHAAEAKQPLATQNLARLQGVKTIRTARADTVRTDVHLGSEPFSATGPIDLPGIDGGGDGGHGPHGDSGLEE